MTTENAKPAREGGDGAAGDRPNHDPQPGERHAGQGADSAMKQLRVWEQRRASDSAVKGREGPN